MIKIKPWMHVALFIYSMALLVTLEVGMMDSIQDIPRRQVRRFEYVLPGYRIGYWLAQRP